MTKENVTSNSDYRLPAEGFVRSNDVLKVIPMSRAAFCLSVKNGLFPQPVRLGERMVAWRVDDIRAYIADPSAFNGLKGGANYDH